VTGFVRSALYDAGHNVFRGVLIAAVALVLVLWLMPRRTHPIDAT
jgi:hypothetical protein